MATMIECPFCGSYDTKKTTNGKVSNGLAKAGAIVGGALLQMVTGVPGAIAAEAGYRQFWHQYCCHSCHEVFRVRMSAWGGVKEIRKY